MDLERLIATEQRLDAALRTAREQGSALLQEARARAREQEAALDAELQAAGRRLTDETAGERERREQEVARDAAARVALLETVSAERVDRAARAVVTLVVRASDTPR